jgi:hypothetical protein
MRPLKHKPGRGWILTQRRRKCSAISTVAFKRARHILAQNRQWAVGKQLSLAGHFKSAKLVKNPMILIGWQSWRKHLTAARIRALETENPRNHYGG